MANIAPKAVLNVSLAGAVGTTADYTVTRPLLVIDVAALCTASGGGGDTLKLGNSATDITNTMAVAAANNLTRTTQLVVAPRTFAIGDLMRVTLTGTAAGTALVSIIPSAIPGNS